jgi:hypothetical protein
MINYVYEIDSYCTSIVARMKNGTVLLGRNLDFYFPEEGKRTIFNGRFYDGDKFLFEAVMFAGMVGVYQG